MKRKSGLIIFILLLLSFKYQQTCWAEELNQPINIIESKDSYLILELKSSILNPIKQEGGELGAIQIADYPHGFITLQNGLNLPEIEMILDIPAGTSPKLTIVDCKKQVFYLGPLTSLCEAGIQENDGGPKKVLAKIKHRLSPFSLVEIESLGGIKAKISFYPVLFDAVNQIFEFYKNIKVKVLFKELKEEEIRTGSLDPRTAIYKISLDEDGIYKVTKDDFIALGINPDEIDPHQVELYNKGEEIAINIKLDYENDTLDYIEFFGQANDSKYSLENIYWLKIRSGTALEMGERDVNPNYGGMNIDYYIDNIHFEENLLYQRSILEGEDVDHWFWMFLIAPNTIDVDFEISDIAQVPEFAELEVKLQGYSYLPQNPDHHVRIYLNDNLLGDAWWDNATQYIFEADIPLDYLINGQNILSLEAPGDTGAPIDTVYLDYFVITYPGQFIAQEDILRFKLTGLERYLVEASGFSQSAIELFDITQPECPVRLLNADILPGGGNYTVIFSDLGSTNEKEYLILTNDKKLSPYSIIEDTLSNLHSVQNQADYIIITHADFEESVLPLAQWRQDNGLEVKVVDIQDIYDEFNFGIFNPEAIKTFLGYAYNYWLIPPHYILLVGDASYDYKDYLGWGNNNFVPTVDVETDMMLAPSDNWFVCVEGEDNLPDMAIGRLPVSTAEELGFIINKIIDYESGLGAAGWNENIMLVADDDEAIFETMQDELEENYIWPSFDVNKIYLSQYLSSALCHQDIIDGINGGALIVNYAGHGAEPIWADELILTSSDIDLLNNYQMYPAVLAMTCLNTYFHYPYPWFYVISETFLKAENKGVIGFWSPSGLTSTSEHSILENGFYSAVFDDDIRILGDAIKEAESYLYENLPPAEDLLKTIILLGDPALELALPQ